MDVGYPRFHERWLDQPPRPLPKRSVGAHDPLARERLEREESHGLHAPARKVRGEDGLEVLGLNGEELRPPVRLRLEGVSVDLKLLHQGHIAAVGFDGSERLEQQVKPEYGISLGNGRRRLATQIANDIAT